MKEKTKVLAIRVKESVYVRIIEIAEKASRSIAKQTGLLVEEVLKLEERSKE